MDELKKYTDYLWEKLEIECDKNDFEENKNKIGKVNKKMIEIKMMEITSDILKKYICYDVIDIEKKNRLGEKNINNICEQYKKYKQNDKINSIEPEISMDININTKDTYYIDTLENVTTKMLINKYGELIKTGDDTTKHRYEYKFLLKYKGKKYIYCIYDYKKDGEFEKEDEINWHIGCNIDKKEITKVFVYYLKKELLGKEENDEY
jgi:hypothetical protein